jgi:hypothetical protein
MNKLILSLLSGAALVATSYAGPEQYSGKEMKQVAAPAPCPEWYGARELDVSVWGAFAFPGNSGSRSLAAIADAHEDNEGGRIDNIGAPQLSNDLFLNTNTAFGGGGDVKYFFNKYIGIGAEGYALGGHGILGGAIGTVTLRYPIGCSRWAPYGFGGIGAAFGGSYEVAGETAIDNEEFFSREVDQSGARLQGQGGAGIEYRLTKHVGMTADFSWNILDGRDNNFGMVRTGINFAF